MIISAERDIQVLRTFFMALPTWYYINKNVFKAMFQKRNAGFPKSAMHISTTTDGMNPFRLTRDTRAHL